MPQEQRVPSEAEGQCIGDHGGWGIGSSRSGETSPQPVVRRAEEGRHRQGLSQGPELPASISGVHRSRQVKEMPGCVCKRGGPGTRHPDLPGWWRRLASLLANAGFRRGPLGAEQLGVGVNQTRRFIPGN